MKLLTLLLAAVAAYGANTTVAQTVIGPDGSPGNGTVSIAISATCLSGSNSVDRHTVTVPFLAGAFSVGLVPNDTCVSWGGLTSTTYAVGWSVCSASVGATLDKPCKGSTKTYAETWRVPTTSSTLPVYGSSGVVLQSPLTTINTAGLSDGSYILTIVNHAATQLQVYTIGQTVTGRTWSSLVGTNWQDVVSYTW